MARQSQEDAAFAREKLRAAGPELSHPCADTERIGRAERRTSHVNAPDPPGVHDRGDRIATEVDHDPALLLAFDAWCGRVTQDATRPRDVLHTGADAQVANARGGQRRAGLDTTGRGCNCAGRACSSRRITGGR